MATTLDEIGFLLSTAREAAETIILPHFANLDPADIRTKAHDSDFVTPADEAAEKLIADRVLAVFGERVLFLGEEIMERDPTLITRLPTAERAVVVDPLDGTYNYVNGVPAFAVIIAVIEAGQVTGGVIYDPIRGDAACAVAGGGAWIQGGGRPSRPLRVAPPKPLGDMLGAATWTHSLPQVRGRLLRGLAEVSAVSNYRCCAQELRLLVSGGLHFGYYHALTPWDHAAGWLIHREAGGYSALLDGSPYRPDLRSGGLLFAPDRASWRLLADALSGK